MPKIRVEACVESFNQSSNIKHIGAYGIAIQSGKILLTVKQKGPYKGLLDLPGGKIEEGETPELALRREFLEEVAMEYAECTFLEHVFHTQQNFEHEGFLFKVSGCRLAAGSIPEELFDWYPIALLDELTLTPFAKCALTLR